MVQILRLIISTFLMFFTLSVDGIAPIKTGSLIRDAEIEESLKVMIRPLFRSAGMNPDNLKLYIVASPEVNAAATINFTIFVNTGLIEKAKNVGQLIGVLAHETGHIAGGHIVRSLDNIRKSSLLAMATTVLGVAAMMAGSSDVGMGLIMGGSSAAQGNFLHYNRGQEASADQAALKILDNLNWPTDGLKEFFQYLAKQEYYSIDRQDAYLFTHPLSSERLSLIENHIKLSKNQKCHFPSDFDYLFERMLAKIFAYTSTPFTTFLKYPQNRTDFTARYARAIAHYRNNDVKAALIILDDLIQQNAQDAYLYELKGQILFEQGQLKHCYAYYKKAHQLLPQNALLHLGLLQVESELQVKSPQKIIDELKKLKTVEQENTQLWHLIAIAYGRMGDEGQAAFALAEKALFQGDTEQAHKQVKRALHFLKGGPEKIAAQDLLNQLDSTPDETKDY